MRHPELARLGRALRHRLDETLDAEQAAAEAAARRRRTLRDLLLAIEDRGDRVSVFSADGRTRAGRITAVGTDHIVLTEEGAPRVALAMDHIVGFED